MRRLCAASWLFGLVLAACGREAAAPCADCNVILLTIDTLRADHVSAYGYARPTTPNIDAFFAQGTRVRQAVSASPCTIPSVRQLLTGRVDPEPEHPRLAERLAAHGFDTAAIVSHQFFRDAEGPLPAYARGFEHFDVQDTSRHGLYGMTTRSASEVTDRALALLAARRSRAPLFLWLHYFDPHDPYSAPESERIFEPRSSPTIDGDRRKTLRDGRGMNLPWERRGGIFSPQEVAYLVAQYDAEIRYTDREIGRFFAQLERSGLVENSLIALTSDHGERLGEDEKWDHCWSLHTSEMRVPLMLRLRGRPLFDVREARFGASTLDLVATVLDVIGAPPDAAGSGRSLLALARTGERARVVRTAWKQKRLALLPPFKLIVEGDGAQRLYDVEQDPEETRDLAEQKARVVAELSDALDAAEEPLDRAGERSNQVLERLRALGYLE
jgi:arylsulfatase